MKQSKKEKQYYAANALYFILVTLPEIPRDVLVNVIESYGSLFPQTFFNDLLKLLHYDEKDEYYTFDEDIYGNTLKRLVYKYVKGY